MININQETKQMIQEYVADLATQLGIKLSRVSIIEGRKVGCLDVHLLHLCANGHLVSTLVYQSELDGLQTGASCERLETKIRAALSRLQILLEP
jgi:translation initiation factor 6 (eIF-6)